MIVIWMKPDKPDRKLIQETIEDAVVFIVNNDHSPEQKKESFLEVVIVFGNVPSKWIIPPYTPGSYSSAYSIHQSKWSYQ